MVDLRSDTVTLPSAGMRAAMAAAEVGDDVYGEDPSVNRLEAEVARILGKQAALFCPSGTMSNLIAILTATHPGEEVLVDKEAHILHYELAGAAVIGGVQLRNFDAANAGCPTGDQLRALERLNDPGHEPRTSLLCLEQTHNRRGGTVAAPEELRDAARTAREMGMLIHLDGARLGNAAARLGIPLRDLADCADSVNFSLSKGLGCPVGSLWVGSREARERAHVWRKRLGGGMRQAGVLAAAGLYALEHQLPRLVEDHEKARRLTRALHGAPGLQVDADRVHTNIVLLQTERPAEEVISRAAGEGVLLTAFGQHTVRCVTHLDVSLAQMDEAAAAIGRAAG
jgi:threonine aldolase